MAGLSESADPGPRSGTGGPFGGLARSQYAALIRMRWLMASHRLRTPQGYWELGARGLSVLFYGAMGLGMSVGFGTMANYLAHREDWQGLSFVFGAILLVWQSVPIGMAWFQSHFEMSWLMRFPVSFGSFFLLHLVAGIADVSTLMGGLCCFGIWIGVSVARPQLAIWALVVVLLFAVLNVMMVRLILLWMDRWLSRRRSREIVGAALVALVLSLQLLNPALRKDNSVHHGSQQQRVMAGSLAREMPVAMSQAAEAINRWLPPGFAALTLQQADRGHGTMALEALAGLGIFGVALALLLGVRVRAEFRGENLGETADMDGSSREVAGAAIRGGGLVSALLQKELLTTMRSMPVMYALGAPLFMVLVLSSLLHTNSPESWGRSAYALPACLAYALMGVSQLIFNTLGLEGGGVRLIFLSPTPVRKVMLAKNLFHGLAFACVATVAWVLTSLRVGWPDEVMTASTVAWLLFALPANLAIGNLFSLKMPHRLDPGKLTRQRGSAATALLTILVQITLIAIAATVFLLSARLGYMWMAVPVFLGLAVAASYMWLRVYEGLDALASENRDLLMQMLARSE